MDLHNASIILHPLHFHQVNSRPNQPPTSRTTIGDNILKAYFVMWREEDKQAPPASSNWEDQPWQAEQTMYVPFQFRIDAVLTTR
jgi:hypothetical protein